jgi:hypothetical protein
MAFESVSRFSDFQAEYEGSIPFTRSSLFIDLARGPDLILTNGLPCTFRCSLSDRLFRASLATLSYSPHCSGPTEVRAHQNRISWFEEEVLNAHVEIGDDGVKIGQVEHKPCEDLCR